MSRMPSECAKEEIEEKIAEIKQILEKDITPFERKILGDVLILWEKALLSAEGGTV